MTCIMRNAWTGDLCAMRSNLSKDDVNNGHEDQEEIKFVPSTAPVVPPAEPCDFDCSFDDKDGCEGVVAVLFGL